jgi:hypothetical protein
MGVRLGRSVILPQLRRVPSASSQRPAAAGVSNFLAFFKDAACGETFHMGKPDIIIHEIFIV